MSKTLPKNWSYMFCALFGIYVAAILWITLFSRIGTYYRGFLFPFQSYVAIFNSDQGLLVENIENMVLFAPLGMAIGLVKKLGWKKILLVGLVTSLCIEILQTLFALGTFECDDLLHNTLGTLVGYWTVNKLGRTTSISSKHLQVAFISMMVFLLLPVGYQAIRYQHMTNLAALHDRSDGVENLLVMKGKNGYAGNTSIYVTYQEDGTIRISGTSENKEWFLLGYVKLEPGIYTFTGLQGVDKNTVAIELEYYDDSLQKYTRLTSDVGPVNNAVFTINMTTWVRALVEVYDGCDCDVTAIPVIYKEE